MIHHLNLPDHERLAPFLRLPRGNAPVLDMDVDEEPFTCIHDGARTAFDEALFYSNGQHYEYCPECGQRYYVEEPDPDDE